MWIKRILIGMAVIAALAVSYFSAPQSASSLIEKCKSEADSNRQIECIFTVINDELHLKGMRAAFEVFTSAYADFPAFVQEGCHHQAHRVGDLVYFGLYLKNGSRLNDLDFPQATTACGYGFYHGFLEHLIQDNPRQEFVDDTCTYLTGRLSADMRDIKTICYHGSGHGFELAHSEAVPNSKWGDIRAFSDAPAVQCDSLKKADPSDIEQCKEGIFNVIVDWMSLKQYGFSYDDKDPFAACDTVPRSSQKACYYEMAQKLDRPSHRDPASLERITNTIADPAFSKMAFSVGIAGIIQQIIEQGGENDLLKKCETLDADHYRTCLKSIVHGLFEHGAPQEEYKKSLVLCANVPRGTDDCYETIASTLRRFYSSDRSREICREFPPAYREKCFSSISSI